MDDCCQGKQHELTALRDGYRRVLWVVLGVNAALFATEFTAGLLAHSSALLADSLDMLGDATVYGASLLALRHGERTQAGVALAKGSLMLLFGALVAVELATKLTGGATPIAPAMGAFGALALAGNLTCAVLLLRFRRGGLDMRSTWLCSRNDVLANLGVLAAAAGVALTGSLWPDVLVGGIIAGLFLHAAGGVIREAVAALRAAPQSA